MDKSPLRCPEVFPPNVWDNFGFSTCFIDFYIASFIPSFFFVALYCLSLWCNYRQRPYSLLVTNHQNRSSGIQSSPHFGPSLIAITLVTTILHFINFCFLLDYELSIKHSQLYGSLVATGIRFITWLFATIFSLYTVISPKPKYPQRGHISYSSVLAVFYIFFGLASLVSLWTIHMPLSSLFSYIHLAAVITNCLLLAMCVISAIIDNVRYVNLPEDILHDSIPETLPPSKEINASLLSLAFFSWFSEIIALGSKKALEVDDLWDLYPNDQAAATNRMFYRTQPTEKSLVYALWLCLRHHLILQTITGTIGALLSFSGPLFLNWIIIFVQSGNTNSAMGLTYVVLLFLFSSIRSIIDNQTYFRGRRVGLRLRAIIIGQVYAKVLQAKDKQSNVGQVINMIQIDANKILEFTSYLHYFITTPMQIAIAVVALYQLLGWASLAGVGVMLCVVPLNALTGKNATRLQHDLMNSTDKRTQVSSEVISGIRTLKTFGWEARTFKWIERIRLGELHHLRKYLSFTVALSLLWYLVPLLVTMGTFFCYAFVMAQPLTATKVFTAISLFMALKMPLFLLPDMLIRFLEVRVSFRRISAYLAKSEIERIPESAEIQLSRASFTFSDTRSGKSVLSDISLTFPKDKLTVICGKSGSSKSSFIQALLGELTIQEGTVQRPQSIALVSQSAWLQNASIRDNILFGSKYNAERYAKVISACGLEKDFALLGKGAGDLTEIGDKGVGLSGGQKSRLNLARAAYSTIKTVIMDDVFSALDICTAKKVFEDCVINLMSDRTRILVTHAVSLCMPRADYVIVFDGGRVISKGPPLEVAKISVMEELVSQDPELASSIFKAAAESVPTIPYSVSPQTSPTTQKSISNTPLESISQNINSPPKTDLPTVRQRHISFESHVSQEESRISHMSTISSMADLHMANTDMYPQPTLNAGQLVAAEERCRGSVSWYVYKTWINAAGGNKFWIVLIFLIVFQQVLTVSQDMWLRHWTNAYTAKGHVDVVHYLVIYIAIGVGTVLVIGLRLMTQIWGSIRASTLLHNKLVDNLLYAKIRFYDTTPLGRIINRISKDIQTIDRDVARDIVDCLYNAFQLVSVVVMISSAAPLFLLFLFPLALLYALLCRYFLNCSRELKRLDSLTRSPIYALFSETLTGTSVIRAFNDEKRFIKEIYRRIDVNHRAFFYLWASNRWLSIRSDHIGALTVLCTGLILVLSRTRMDPALCGLILSYSLNVSDCLMWLIRVQAMVEMDMNSIERIEEWNERIDREPDSGLVQHQVPPNWPADGAIDVKELSVQYATAVPVLHNITFSVSPCSRVAAVGRTGAGKSTLAAALLRFVDFTHGCILIDGVDISQVNLPFLRARITMVPQDPVLFSGTLRSNLDVFNLYTDDEVLDVLKRVHLQHLSLNDTVTEGGTNYSVGMRQMLSLGRALLRRTRVLILDEATGSIDAETEALITETIRHEFKNCTIITIAHRLETIIDYDQVLVLDTGCIREFGSPRELMARPEGLFYKMCKESGQFDSLYYEATTPKKNQHP